MHFLVVNRFFGGDQVPTGRMLWDVAVRLAAAGHRVTALVSPDAYANERGVAALPAGIAVRRLWGCRRCGRTLAWALYWLQAVLLVPLLRWDRCVLLTDPPFLLAAAPLAKWLGRRRRLYWWTMDLYPEALVADGMICPGGWLHGLLRGINGAGLRRLDGVVALGEAQVARLRAYAPWRAVAARTLVVPPWDDRPLARDDALVRALRARFGWGERRVVLYAGNLGRGHSDADALAAARLSAAAGADWVFAFFCRGARRDALAQASAGLANVLVRDYVAPEETAALLHAADVHLITMADGWDGVVVPSKLYGVLQTQAPVLFIGPEGADTAREIRRLGVGACLPNGCGGEAVLAALEDLPRAVPAAAGDAVGVAGPARVAGFLAERTRPQPLRTVF